MSWSGQIHSSLNLWNLAEGTHVLTLIFFAGTIWIVDLRLLGLAFRDTPFSKLNDRVLPITIVSFAVMVVTGLISFFGRDPLLYYHDVWFRFKMIFLALATLNIFWFHFRVQRDQETWDAMASPPLKVRMSGAVSLVAWLLIIIFGRFIAYDWYRCEKVPEGSFVYTFAECKAALGYLDAKPASDANDPASSQPAPAESNGADAPPAPIAEPATPKAGG
jgi:hypothetical protein